MPFHQSDGRGGGFDPAVGGERHAVLITRPAADAKRTAAAVRQLGWEPVLAPLLRVRGCAVAWPGKPIAAVLLTSGNAVPALAGLPATLVLTVGDATAERVRWAGFADVDSAGGDAAALLVLARRRLPEGARVLLLSGAGQGGALAAGLREAGFTVLRRVAYSAEPVGRLPPDAVRAIADRRVRAALFLSADTARVFVRVLPVRLRPLLAGVEALAIAPGVAAALAPLPWRRVRVSVGPTLDQVLALL